jgi:hypothetical protein
MAKDKKDKKFKDVIKKIIRSREWMKKIDSVRGRRIGN